GCKLLPTTLDFLRDNSTGECVDAAADFFIFTVNNGKIVKKRPVGGKIFPKCCPLGYVYNSVYHSCEKKQNSVERYIEENFVKVGLPNCKIIVDYEVNGTDNFDYTLINTTRKPISRNDAVESGTYCIDESEKSTFVIRECKDTLKICDDIRCVRKCCPDGQSFINGSKCFDTYVHGLNLSSFSSVENPEAPYAVIHNRSCKIYMMKEENYRFKLDERGVFSFWQNTTESFVYESIDNFKSHCIEYTQKPTVHGYFFFKCFSEKAVNNKYKYTLYPKVLSCLCLILTIVFYVYLKETKRMFGKVLVNYCLVLLIENAVLAYAQNNLTPTYLECQIRSFAIIYFATAAFSWSNVMCCDIWWKFGSIKQTIGVHQRNRDIKRLVKYLLYGWGIPTILTLIIYLFYQFRVLPYSIQPFLGQRRCFFEKRVFIFIIFICKTKVLIELLEKLRILSSKGSSSASLNTQSTTTSNGTSLKVLNVTNRNDNVTVNR
ncbi:hypothetical protein NQ317_015995, partial [Molorchus minor]